MTPSASNRSPSTVTVRKPSRASSTAASLFSATIVSPNTKFTTGRTDGAHLTNDEATPTTPLLDGRLMAFTDLSSWTGIILIRPSFVLFRLSTQCFAVSKSSTTRAFIQPAEAASNAFTSDRLGVMRALTVPWMPSIAPAFPISSILTRALSSAATLSANSSCILNSSTVLRAFSAIPCALAISASRRVLCSTSLRRTSSAPARLLFSVASIV